MSNPPPGGTPRFYGKYRGTVVANADPQQTGRITVNVPDVLGATVSSWALPCVPAAGPQAGMYIVPPAGSSVWVEFEQGDPDYPIWTGGFWGASSEVPPLATSPAPVPPGQNIVIQTTGLSTMMVSDAPPTTTAGGVVLQSGQCSIVVNSTGIYITNGSASIQLVGPTVTVNSGALTVT
jgi:type VI secretion system (T6SS) baseplate-like injector VgrG